MARARPVSRLLLDSDERQALLALSRARTQPVRLVERSKIILLAADGLHEHQIARSVGVCAKTVRRWCDAYQRRRAAKPESSVALRLADRSRVGRPDRFDEYFWIDVLVMATATPESFGRPITHWTLRELTDEIIRRRLTDSIHFTTVGRFLKEATLQPHRVREWMNRKEDPQFDERAEEVKRCLVEATADPPPAKIVTVSFDEKTGVQAKERIAPPQPMKPGRPQRLEFEYARHGVLVLFAMMVVHSGAVLGRTLFHRTNVLTAAVLADWLAGLLAQGYERIHVVLDQLNTHFSHDLIEAVTRLCGLPHPPAAEIATGKQRRAWLSSPDKPIVFHYTPLHASWLNPIEMWFGVLVRKVLRRGSFRSTEDLAGRIDRFIEYYNLRLAHPYHFKLHKKRAA